MAKPAEDVPLPSDDDRERALDPAAASNGDSWSRPTETATAKETSSLVGDEELEKKKKKKMSGAEKAKKKKEKHEQRENRGEPQWHGDQQERWHDRRASKPTRSHAAEDPWSQYRSRTDRQRDRRHERKEPRGRYQHRRQGRSSRRSTDSSRSSSQSSLATTTTSQSESPKSSSTKSRRHRKKHFKKKTDHSRNVKIPVFDGTYKLYREYRRNVHRYTRLVGKEGTGLALQLNLTGEALEATRHLPAKKLKDRKGVRLLLDCLDDEYRGLREDRLDEVAEEFVQCRRTTGESMTRYMRRLREARRELEEEDEKMYVSNSFFAWMLLRRAGLTAEEKSRVRGACHCSEDPRDLSYALKRLFPAHQARGERQDRMIRGQWDDQQRSRGRAALQATLEEEEDESEDSSSAEDNVTDEFDFDEGGDQEVLAAMKVIRDAERAGCDTYALYRSAKVQQRGKMKSRGFFKSSTQGPQGQSKEERQRQIQQAKAASTCRACGQSGHWANDAVCPKFKARPKREDGKVREAQVVQTMTLPHVGEVFLTSAGECSEALGILDSGCQRTVMGIVPFGRWESKLRENGTIDNSLPRLETDEIFKFGNSGRLKALFRVQVPVEVFGKRSLLDLCIVAGETPLLISRATMTKLGLTIDFHSQTITSSRLDVSAEPLSEHCGHLVLNLLVNRSKAESAYKAELSHEFVGDSFRGGAQGIHHDEHVQTNPYLEDTWDWLTPDVCRRRHGSFRTSAFCPSQIDGMPLEGFASVSLQISHSPGLDTKVTPVSLGPNQPGRFELNAWVGETWFWKRHVSKRELYSLILGRSHFPIKPRSLRRAWQDGHREVLNVLGRPAASSFPTSSEAAEHSARTKEQLVTELMSMPENKHPPKALKRMYVIELRALWKTLNNVTPHPGNPLKPREYSPEARSQEPLPAAQPSSHGHHDDRINVSHVAFSLGDSVQSGDGSGLHEQDGEDTHGSGVGGVGEDRAGHGSAARSGGGAGDLRAGGDRAPGPESSGCHATSSADATGSGSADAKGKGEDIALDGDELFKELFQGFRKTMKRADRVFVADRLVQYQALATAPHSWEKSLGRTGA